MKVSVIIPTHNRSTLVVRSVESVLRQTYPTVEIVVVDDGSVDDTAVKLQPYYDTERIAYLKKINTGAADSRNYGVKHSTGDLITFLDSDDEAVPEWIEQLVNAFGNDENCKIVFCGCTMYDEHGNERFSKFPTKKGPLYQKLVCRFTNSGIFMLRRKFFESIGGYDAKLPASQHTELGIRAAKAIVDGNYSTAALQLSLVKIHLHLGPRIRTNSPAKSAGVKMLYEKHKRIILKDKKNRVDLLKILALNSIKAKNIIDSARYISLYWYYRYLMN